MTAVRECQGSDRITWIFPELSGEKLRASNYSGKLQGHLIFKNNPRMTPMQPMGADQIGEHPPHRR
jgi:hypothetical protein